MMNFFINQNLPKHKKLFCNQTHLRPILGRSFQVDEAKRQNFEMTFKTVRKQVWQPNSHPALNFTASSPKLQNER